MKKLYAPWRNDYTTQVTGVNNVNVPEKNCVFCQQYKQDDAQSFILGRFVHTVVMLNLYPYNAGHLLILPKKHCADLDAMTREARSELMELTMHAIDILKQTLAAQGTNIGLNLGKAAGAGIPSHLHMHILPRWIGDTNFLPLLADTKQVSTDLHKIYDQLLPHFQLLEKKIISSKEK